MDKNSAILVDFTQGFSLEDVPAVAADAGLKHVVDAVVCAIAGYDTAPAQAAVRAARHAPGAATVFGAGFSAAPPYAAMANAVMVRVLDWNDGMLARGGGHPSDMIPGILAVAEVADASGHDVLEAVVLAYELLGGIGNVAPSNRRGWDQGLFMAVAVALAVGKLQGLTAEQLGHALSLAVISAVPLLVTRRGALSMWKGAATSVAVRHALDCVTLAKEGMTGPSEPFEGTMGVFDQLTGPFEVQLPANPGGRWVTEISHMKRYPAESHSQSLLGFVPSIREWSAVEDITAIEVECYWEMFNAIGSHASVWDPQNRETADHSLPYLLAVALIDGEVGLRSFDPDRIADPALRPVMAKISVRENPEFTAEYRPRGQELAAAPHVRITVRRRDGEVLVHDLSYPKGHSMNPLTVADVDAKLHRATAAFGDEEREALRAAWWSMAEAPRIASVIRTVSGFGHTVGSTV
jgi:2-methylcitrate dehydratase